MIRHNLDDLASADASCAK